MKTTIITPLIVLASLSLFGCVEEGRIDQIDPDAPAPSKVTVTEVISKPGGAIIKYRIPNDDNIMGVQVTYERNGEECHNMSSRYVDSLVVEGFGDTQAHPAVVQSISANGKVSEPTEITITPEVPMVMTAKLDLFETFGGIIISMEGNEDESDLAIVLMSDPTLADDGKPAHEMEWQDLYTFHTSSKKGTFVRHDIEAESQIFGAYLRDRWGNASDTLYKVMAPLFEEELPYKTWKNALLPTDCGQRSSSYAFTNMFDRSTSKFYYTPLNGPLEVWFTLSLGYTAQISRLRLLPAKYSFDYKGVYPQHWQVYGSMDPNPDGSWDESWFLLKDIYTYKPSGYTGEDGAVGDITEEDAEWFEHVSEYAFEATEEVPNPQRPVRYLRFKFLRNFNTFLMEIDDESSITTYFGVDDLYLWGQIIEEK